MNLNNTQHLGAKPDTKANKPSVNIKAEHSIEGTFKAIRLSWDHAGRALSLVQPAVLIPPEAQAINNTNFAHVLTEVRDALLHRATLGIVRIYDLNAGKSNNKDRVVFDRLINLMMENGDKYNPNKVENAQQKYLEIKQSDHFTQLKKIRHGRIAHWLDDRGRKSICEALYKTYNNTTALIEILESIIPGEYPTYNQFWNDSGRSFWNCIFREGKNYASQERMQPDYWSVQFEEESTNK